MRLVTARMHGAALLLVLWLIALLAALIGAFAFTARIDGLQGHLLREDAMAREVARAGGEYAIARLRRPDPKVSWAADGRIYTWQFAGDLVHVRIVDESGKVDVNRADPAVLAALLRQCGAGAETARHMAGAIVDWRDADDLVSVDGAEASAYAEKGLDYGPKNAPFESVAEVEQVLGMTPAVFAQCAPNLTLYGHSQPDPRFAPEPVLHAVGVDAALWLMQREGDASLVGFGGNTYSIDSWVQLADGRRSGVRMRVRLGGRDGTIYTLLQRQDLGMSGDDEHAR